MSPKTKPKLVIFDGHGIMYRAFYAFKEPLTVRKTGEIVTVPFGFAKETCRASSKRHRKHESKRNRFRHPPDRDRPQRLRLFPSADN